MGERTASDADISNLMRRMDDLEERQDRREATQDRRHEENSDRLKSIERTLLEISVTFKLGRWLMHILWMIGGTAVGLAIAKWAGIKP